MVLQGIQSGYTAPLPGRGNFLLWGNLCHTPSPMGHFIPDMLSTFPDVLITPSDMSYTPRDMHEHFLVLNVICPPQVLYPWHITVYDEPISAFHKYFTLSEVLYILLWRAITPSCIQHTPPSRVTSLSLIPKNTYSPGDTKYGWCPWFFTIFRGIRCPQKYENR